MTSSVVCNDCNDRIPTYQRKLKCYICDQIKHHKCQKLSKKDVNKICKVRPSRWACHECIYSILPVDAASRRRPTPLPRVKTKCSACNGFSYTTNNIESCPWCDGVCHKKCLKGGLGCIKCCESINLIGKGSVKIGNKIE